MRAALERRLLELWYASSAPGLHLLQPLESLFVAVSRQRRRQQQQHAVALPVPVIVVGNLAVGGTGKTPLVIALARLLGQAGVRVGVVSRGYGGSARRPMRVVAASDPSICGDEPLLLASRIDGPVWTGEDRVHVARELLAGTPVDVILSDDGLQHYRLARTLEICVLDAERWLGNGYCLPRGPLRESPTRLAEVDYVIANGDGEAPRGVPVHGRMQLVPGAWRRVHDDAIETMQLPRAGERVHAVAGIGNPQRFFGTLRQLGFEPIEHPFGDHHRFVADDLAFGDAHRVVMTEKDAVKCRRFAVTDWLALEVEARVPESLATMVLQHVSEQSRRRRS